MVVFVCDVLVTWHNFFFLVTDYSFLFNLAQPPHIWLFFAESKHEYIISFHLNVCTLDTVAPLTRTARRDTEREWNIIKQIIQLHGSLEKKKYDICIWESTFWLLKTIYYIKRTRIPVPLSSTMASIMAQTIRQKFCWSRRYYLYSISKICYKNVHGHKIELQTSFVT